MCSPVSHHRCYTHFSAPIHVRTHTHTHTHAHTHTHNPPLTLTLTLLRLVLSQHEPLLPITLCCVQELPFEISSPSTVPASVNLRVALMCPSLGGTLTVYVDDRVQGTVTIGYDDAITENDCVNCITYRHVSDMTRLSLNMTV
jgi:hypothetical protein